MKIKELKDYLRPIEKLYKYGVKSLSVEELLAILINTGTKDKSCIDLAKEILNSLNNLSDLLDKDIEELIKFKGIGKKKAALIIASFEFVRRCQSDIKIGNEIIDKNMVQKILLPRICGIKYEKLFVLYLNIKCRLIKIREFDNNGVSFVEIPIRNIIKEAIDLKSSFIIISHNHPSGDTKPSRNDIESTRMLEDALSYVNIALIDHVIISSNNVYSLKEHLDM